MTTLQLANALARHTRFPDLASTPADVRLEILHAINAALQTVYSRLPAAYKRQPFSALLRAPADVNLTFTAQYATTTTGDVFTEAQKRCTVLVSGDADYNQVTGLNSVRDAFTGSTLATTARVWSDAIPVDATIERLSKPLSVFRNGEKVTELTRWDEPYDVLAQPPGTPERYSVEPVAASQGSDPEFYLRVWPLPVDVFKIRAEVEISTVRVTFAQIVNAPAVLPIGERMAESILLPIAKAAFTDSTAWENPSTIARIRDGGAAAEEQIKLIAMDFAPGFNSVGTPAGY
jgi:hypothetical protein